MTNRINSGKSKQILLEVAATKDYNSSVAEGLLNSQIKLTRGSRE